MNFGGKFIEKFVTKKKSQKISFSIFCHIKKISIFLHFSPHQQNFPNLSTKTTKRLNGREHLN
jgi:hypothetical protein